MPVIHINIKDGLTVDQKREVAKKVTNVFEESLSIASERIEIFFHDIPDTNFAKAGQLLCDIEKK